MYIYKHLSTYIISVYISIYLLVAGRRSAILTINRIATFTINRIATITINIIATFTINRIATRSR